MLTLDAVVYHWVGYHNTYGILFPISPTEFQIRAGDLVLARLNPYHTRAIIYASGNIELFAC